jgi:hypothetical protein
MRARKHISLEELFRLYPQLRLTASSEAGQSQDGQVAADSQGAYPSALAEQARSSSACAEV